MDKEILALLKEPPRLISKAQSMRLTCEVLAEVCYKLAETHCVLEKDTVKCSCGRIYYKNEMVNSFIKNGDEFKKFANFWKAQAEFEKRRIEKYGNKRVNRNNGKDGRKGRD